MKKGFSIIELIVSIVVIGIIFLSVPTILLQNSRSNEMSIIQQSVMDAKTRMALILKSPWACTGDENLTNLPTPIFGGLQNFYTTNSIERNKAREFSNIDRDRPCVDKEKGLNSFYKEKITFTVSPLVDVPVYSRDNIISATLDTNVTDFNMAGTKDINIKEIIITAKTSVGDNNTTIVLRAYSSNIGDSPALDFKEW